MCSFVDSLDRGIRACFFERQTQTIRPTVRRQRHLQPHLRISFEFRRFLPIHDAGSSSLKDETPDSRRHRHATPRRLRKGASSDDQLRISSSSSNLPSTKALHAHHQNRSPDELEPPFLRSGVVVRDSRTDRRPERTGWTQQMCQRFRQLGLVRR